MNHVQFRGLNEWKLGLAGAIKPVKLLVLDLRRV